MMDAAVRPVRAWARWGVVAGLMVAGAGCAAAPAARPPEGGDAQPDGSRRPVVVQVPSAAPRAAYEAEGKAASVSSSAPAQPASRATSAAASPDEAACRAADAKACSALAAQHEGRNPELWAQYLDLACSHGDIDACRRLADALDPSVASRGIPKDARRAVDLKVKSCLHGSDGLPYWYGDCANAAYAYAEGRGIAKDQQRATDLFIKACDEGAGPPQPCWELAERYEKGIGTPADPARAAATHAIVCQAGGAEEWGLVHCRKAAALYRSQHQPERAQEIMHYICLQEGRCKR